MSTDLHIAVLTVGLILIAAALVVTLVRMAGRQAVLAGVGPRLVMGLVGAALILWAVFAAHPRTMSASVATGARAAGAGAAGAIGGPAPAAAQSPATASVEGTSPAPATSAVVQPARTDLIVMAGTELDDCTAPKRPSDPPDGASATHAQMAASDAQAQAFNTATNAYLACLDQAASSFSHQYGAVLNANGLREVEAIRNRIHNKAVDVDRAVADKFNQQLRIYQVRGKTS